MSIPEEKSKNNTDKLWIIQDHPDIDEKSKQKKVQNFGSINNKPMNSYNAPENYMY